MVVQSVTARKTWRGGGHKDAWSLQPGDPELVAQLTPAFFIQPRTTVSGMVLPAFSTNLLLAPSQTGLHRGLSPR